MERATYHGPLGFKRLRVVTLAFARALSSYFYPTGRKFLIPCFYETSVAVLIKLNMLSYGMLLVHRALGECHTKR